MVSKSIIWVAVPRFWMTLGVVLFVAAMGLSYHNDQNLADRTLATKVNLPEPVRIQDFDRSKNTNLLGELQLLAEADISRSVVETFTSEDVTETYLLLPVFAVTEGAEARAQSVVDPINATPHRPVPRDARSSPTAPLAVLVYDLTEISSELRSIEALGFTRLGRGFAGELVVLSGLAFRRSLLSESTPQGRIGAAARRAFDLPDEAMVPLIAPYVARRAAPDGADMTDARNLLASLASVALLFGLSLFVRGHAKRPVGQKAPRVRVSHQTKSRPSTPYFDPLTPQDEIQRAEQDARTRSDLSFTGLSRRVGPTLSRIKSRR